MPGTARQFPGTVQGCSNRPKNKRSSSVSSATLSREDLPSRYRFQFLGKCRDILIFLELTKGRPPNLESSSGTRQCVSPKLRESLENVYMFGLKSRNWGVAFPGKFREMKKTPSNRDCRQISKIMSRLLYLGQVRIAAFALASNMNASMHRFRVHLSVLVSRCMAVACTCISMHGSARHLVVYLI